MAPSNNNNNSKKPPVKKKKKKTSGMKVLLGLVIAALLALICALGIYLVVYMNGVKILRENFDKLEDPLNASVIYDSGNTEIAKLIKENRENVKFEEFPDMLVKAFVATEDRRFWEHGGVDIWSIGRAVVKDVIARSAVEGASTITQQLAKNVFLNSDKTFFRKGTEMSIALALEQEKTKEEILEKYLNRIYFGSQAYGVKAASKRYFGITDLRQLELWQIATLAGLPKAPSKYSPISDPEASKERREVILRLMTDQGIITEEQRAQAAAVDYNPETATSIAQVNMFPTFRDYVIKEANDKYGVTEEQISNGGYKIYTTMNSEAQKAMDKAYTNAKLFQPNGPKQPMQSAMVIVDNTNGGIVAMIGGRDYKPGTWNRAIKPRQPGSAFKPVVVYAPAIEKKGYLPSSILDDTKQEFNGYNPRNYDGRYLGQVDMTYAIKKSKNIPAVWLLSKIGISTGKQFAESLGLTFDEKDNNLAIALGGMTRGESPLQMAQAYSAFANNGVLNPSFAILKIEKSDGTLIEHKPEPKKVMSEKTSWYMTQMMQEVLGDGGTGVKANFGRPLAGKTGSTQLDLKGLESDYRDIWFVGYTPQWTGAVWTGFDETNPQHYVRKAYSDRANMIFSAVMSEAMKGMPVKGFERPSGGKPIETPKQDINTVTDLRARFENNTVRLSWSAANGADSYQVFRKGPEGDFVPITPSNTTEYIDQAVQPGASYQYYVVPANGEAAGVQSNVASVTVPGEVAPTPTPSDPNENGNGEGNGNGNNGNNNENGNTGNNGNNGNNENNGNNGNSGNNGNNGNNGNGNNNSGSGNNGDQEDNGNGEQGNTASPSPTPSAPPVSPKPKPGQGGAATEKPPASGAGNPPDTSVGTEGR
ncbi:transglycosylase domain-containing protein [Paenibacillus lutrae]|uniref:PBP1A family penicillin-binding protein n=1 Tax=Paenibacillus lutrae TaxID=2078573 RepID=A0A7X3FIY8_9BACL|nr:penicillin-binding protein 1A [Paenibacillus lutrae]MVP00432.1 PBP1A family penicillin-binding protein [Paenibacillus lutrae]